MLLHSAMIEDYFFKAIPRQHLDVGDGNMAYKTGLPVADLNLVYIRQDPRNWADVLRRSKEFFAQDQLEFVVITPTTLCIPEVVHTFKKQGYLPNGQSVSMGMEIDPANALTNHDQLDIRLETGALHNWMQPLISAFESTEDICKAYATLHEQALTQGLNLFHFTLYIDNCPASSLTLTLHDGVARIDDMGTMTPFQGKGYATHLMHYALQEATRRGARYCCLESSDSGLALYEKIGFQALFRHQIYCITARP